MKVLLDTHILLYWLEANQRLSRKHKEVLYDF